MNSFSSQSVLSESSSIYSHSGNDKYGYGSHRGLGTSANREVGVYDEDSDEDFSDTVEHGENGRDGYTHRDSSNRYSGDGSHVVEGSPPRRSPNASPERANYRMSTLGPKMKLLSRAPWEDGNEEGPDAGSGEDSGRDSHSIFSGITRSRKSKEKERGRERSRTITSTGSGKNEKEESSKKGMRLMGSKDKFSTSSRSSSLTRPSVDSAYQSYPASPSPYSQLFQQGTASQSHLPNDQSQAEATARHAKSSSRSRTRTNSSNGSGVPSRIRTYSTATVTSSSSSNSSVPPLPLSSPSHPHLNTQTTRPLVLKRPSSPTSTLASAISRGSDSPGDYVHPYANPELLLSRSDSPSSAGTRSRSVSRSPSSTPTSFYEGSRGEQSSAPESTTGTYGPNLVPSPHRIPRKIPSRLDIDNAAEGARKDMGRSTESVATIRTANTSVYSTNAPSYASNNLSPKDANFPQSARTMYSLPSPTRQLPSMPNSPQLSHSWTSSPSPSPLPTPNSTNVPTLYHQSQNRSTTHIDTRKISQPEPIGEVPAGMLGFPGSPAYHLISLEQARDKARGRARSGTLNITSTTPRPGYSTPPVPDLPPSDPNTPVSSDSNRKSLKPKRSGFFRMFKEKGVEKEEPLPSFDKGISNSVPSTPKTQAFQFPGWDEIESGATEPPPLPQIPSQYKASSLSKVPPPRSATTPGITPRTLKKSGPTPVPPSVSVVVSTPPNGDQRGSQDQATLRKKPSAIDLPTLHLRPISGLFSSLPTELMSDPTPTSASSLSPSAAYRHGHGSTLTQANSPLFQSQTSDSFSSGLGMTHYVLLVSSSHNMPF
jgi:hypothetical protein